MKNTSKVFAFLLVALMAVMPSMSLALETQSDTDQCANIPGDQLTIPAKYYQTEGNCYISHVPGQPDTKNPDYCLNIEGIQTALPTVDHVRNDRGQCLVPVDVCPNLSGIQSSVPKNYALVDASCVYTIIKTEGSTEVQDVCKNIPGLQTSISDKYYQESGNCYIAHVPGQPDTRNPDYCLNIAGIQTYLPQGYTFRNDRGNCVMPVVPIVPTVRK